MDTLTSPDLQPIRLHDSIAFNTTVVARMMERRVEEGLRAHGLTRIGWCILVALVEENLTRPSEIADFLAIDRTGTSRALRQLEDGGLIQRQIGRGDRRNTEVSITPEGRDVLDIAMPLCTENMAHFAARLSAQEEATLLGLLHKLRAAEDEKAD